MSHGKDEKPTILSYPSGVKESAYWRMHWPTYQLMVMERAVFNISLRYLRDSVAYYESSVVFVQRVTRSKDVDFLEKLCSLKKELDFRLVYEVDEIIFLEDVPNFHSTKKKSNFYDKEATAYAMNLSDEVVVSTPYLKQYYLQKGIKSNFSVIPNYIPYFWGGNFYNEGALVSTYQKHKSKPRILYAGGVSYFSRSEEKGEDDFSHVMEAIKSSIHEFTWVFLGELPPELMEYNRGEEVEFVAFETMDSYPKKIAALECSMMIAPLSENAFNHAKSDTKFQQAAAHGLPIACQDITPYKHCPIRFDSGEKMLEVIRNTLKDEESFVKASREARMMIDKSWLELPQNYLQYEELFSYPYGDSRRKYLIGSGKNG